MFAKKGVHIHLDKPGGESVEEFEELLSIIKRQNLILSMGYMYRFNPAVLHSLDRMNQGKLGDIYAVEAHMDCSHTPKKRQWLKQFKGGMTFYLGCHLVDLVLHFKGIPDKIIPYNYSVGTDNVTANDNCMAIMLYKDGASFIKACAAETGGFKRRQLVVCGSKGTVEIKPIEMFTEKGGSILSANYKETLLNDGETYANWMIESVQEKYEFDRYDAMMRNFVERIRSGEQGQYTLEYEARLHRCVLLASGIDCDFKGEIKI